MQYLFFFLLHESYPDLVKNSMSSTLRRFSSKFMRPPQLTMYMVGRRTKTSEMIMWELGVIHQTDSMYAGLLLGCACLILSVFLSQDSAAILGRIEGYDARWIEPKFQKDQLVMARLNSFFIDAGRKHLKCCFCWDGGICRKNTF